MAFVFNGFYRENDVRMFKQGQFQFALRIDTAFDGTKSIIMEFTDDCPLNIKILHVCTLVNETTEVKDEHLLKALDVLSQFVKKHQKKLKNLLAVMKENKLSLKKQIAWKGKRY